MSDSKFKQTLKKSLASHNMFLEQQPIDSNPYNTRYSIQSVDVLMDILESNTEQLSQDELKLCAELVVSIKKAITGAESAILTRCQAFPSKSISSEAFMETMFSAIMSLEIMASQMFIQSGIDSTGLFSSSLSEKSKLINKLN